VSVPEEIYSYIEAKVRKDRKKQAEKNNVIQGFFDKWFGLRNAA